MGTMALVSRTSQTMLVKMTPRPFSVLENMEVDDPSGPGLESLSEPGRITVTVNMQITTT
jgi:hypothetical protein